MNKLVGILLVVVFVWTCLPAAALAQAPARVTFQGFVTDSAGLPVDGPTDLTFSLYAVATGGTALYQETQTVAVDSGEASVEIGEVTPLDLILFQQFPELYLGLALGVDPELTPRLRLAASPYAASAAYAGNATTLQGLSPADLQNSATPPASNVVYDNTGTDLTATSSQAAINALLARIQSLESQVTSLQATLTDLQAQINTNAATISNVDAVAQDHETRVALLESQTLDTRLVAVEDKTASIFTSTLDGHPAVVFSGVNVVIRNNAGSTNTTNGRGNLVIGYNTLRGDATDFRDGSHNLVLGDKNSHTASAYASIVAGTLNDVQAGYAAAIGGNGNLVSGPSAVINGSNYSVASGSSASITGGHGNTASGHGASVTGGIYNEASGRYSTVSGGEVNQATGYYAAVSGGRSNIAAANHAVCSGGYFNSANADYSTVSGGHTNTAGEYYGVVSGGYYNSANGMYSVVSGGLARTVTGSGDWRGGDLFQEQ